MLEGIINSCKRRINQLNALAENEDLTPEEAKDIAEKLEQEHHYLTQLTGDKGDRRPKT